MTQVGEFLRSSYAIDKWLATYCDIHGTYTINEDCTVSVTGSVNIKADQRYALTHFEVEFKAVTGTFSCMSCRRLTSLRGSPRTVGHKYICADIPTLPSLVGAPDWVGAEFLCHNNVCTTLEGAPSFVGGDFNCRSSSLLTSLQGAPETVNGSFTCYECVQLSSLVGAPVSIAGDFSCSGCPLLRDLSGLMRTRIAGEIFIDTRAKQKAAVVRAFMQNGLRFNNFSNVVHRSKWRHILNSYQESGDLLTAIAQFEDYFKEPYMLATPTVDPVLVVPAL